MDPLFTRHLRQHQALFSRLDTLAPAVERAAERITRSLGQGGKLLLCGNGGSAADCQHIAAELTGRLVTDRPPLAALALTTDTSALTCIANDYAFDEVFARQVAGLGRAGDVLLAISTSGHSRNVIRAVQVARAQGLSTVGLLGRDGGALAGLCDLTLIVPHAVTARIQEAHILIGHVLCAAIEQGLQLVPETPDDATQP